MLTDLNGDVTPFSGEKIDNVDSTAWNTLPLSRLYADLTTLQNRLQMCHTLGNITLINQISAAIQRLEVQIQARIESDKLNAKTRLNSYT